MLRTLFVLIILVGGIAAATVNRFAALLLYVWFALFRPQEWMWIDITALRLSVVLALLLVIPSLLAGYFPAVTHPIGAGMTMFFVTAAVAHVGAVRPDISLAWLDFMFRLFLIAMLAITIVNSRSRFRQMVAVVSLSLAFHAGIAGFQSLASGGLRFGEGQSGAFIDNNGYALAIAMVVPLLFATSRDYNSGLLWARPIRWLSFLAIPFCAYTVVSVFSRAGFLALVAATLVTILLQKRRFLVLFVCLAVLAAALPFIPIPEGYFDRIETIRTFKDVEDSSAVSRLHFWYVAVEMAQDHPLGIGLRNYEAQYDHYDTLNGQFGRGRSVHSSHFQVLAELGFGGAAVWFALFGYSLWRCFKMRRVPESWGTEAQKFFQHYANALLASMIAFVVGGAFIALALNDLTWLTFALVASLDRLYRAQTAESAALAPAADEMSVALDPAT